MQHVTKKGLALSYCDVKKTVEVVNLPRRKRGNINGSFTSPVKSNLILNPVFHDG